MNRTWIPILLILILCASIVSFPRPTHAAKTIRIVLTSGTSWTVPNDWSSASNTVEVIGGGGGGGSGQGTGPGGGGGGGAYAKKSNVSLSGGSSITIAVGSGGGAGTAGGDTYFNGASCGASSACAKGGSGGTNNGGAGGVGASGVGDTTRNGGTGGNGRGSCTSSAGGGGGAAGKINVGSNGVAGGASGGNGGTGDSGSGGSAGSGGSGSGGAGSGGNGAEWQSAVGSGGGGGGGYGNAGNGGKGGGFGGAGGGGGSDGACGGFGTGGAGSQGVIVIHYDTATNVLTITASTTITGGADVRGGLYKGSGTFVIDHPLDPKNKLLYHSFVESPDAMNIYDGITVLGSGGEATVTLPGYFLALNKDFNYLLTPIGKPMPDLHVSKEIRRSFFGLFGSIVFKIAGGVPGGKVSWQVSGVRHDPYILANPIIPVVEKGPDSLKDKGELLCEECYAK